MNAAASLTLEVFSEEIALSLLDKTLGGNLTSAKLLFALAEGQINCEDQEMVQRLCTLAEKLASEPQWDGKTIEAKVDKSSEPRKLEG
jgi:hypothetical protein